MISAGESHWRPLTKAAKRRAIGLKTVKGRARTDLFLVEGFRLLTVALAACWPLEAVIVCDDDKTRRRLARLLGEHRSLETDVYTAARRVIQEVADTVESSGVIAMARQKAPAFSADTLPGGRLLIVDNVRDPGNLGAILRSAAAFGLDGVYLSRGTVDVYNPKVIRASMGAHFILPITPVADLPGLGENLYRQRITLFVADPHSGRTLNQIGQPAKWALVIGGETEGFSDIWREYNARPLRIPLSPKVESLNSAVAAGILLYQLGGRQRARPRTVAQDRKTRGIRRENRLTRADQNKGVKGH